MPSRIKRWVRWLGGHLSGAGALAACATATQWPPPLASADELRTLGELEALCAFSAPMEASAGALPIGAGLTDPLLLSAGRRSYLFERIARLFAVYTVQTPTRALTLSIASPPKDAAPPPADDDTDTDTDTNADAAAVQLNLSGPLSLPQGAFALDLKDDALTFDGLSPAAAERLMLAHRAGLLTLEVDFGLCHALEGRYCEGDASQRRIQGAALQARLRHVGSQEVIAVANTAAGAARRARYAPEATTADAVALRPRVEVTRIDCLNTSDEAGDADDCLPTLTTQWLQDEVELQLLVCYAQTLRAQGRTQGALSLRFNLTTAGHIERPQVSIDALASDAISTCALAALAHLTLPAPLKLPGPPDASPRSLGLVAIFKPTKR